jgi:hypothetical protein
MRCSLHWQHATSSRAVPTRDCRDVCGSILLLKGLKWSCTDITRWFPILSGVPLPVRIFTQVR